MATKPRTTYFHGQFTDILHGCSEAPDVVEGPRGVLTIDFVGAWVSVDHRDG